MAYRTLGELRSTLMARLGMGAQGASGASAALMNSLLANGQTQLYWAQDWKHLIDYEDKTLGVDQNLIDYPTEGVMAGGSAARDRRILRVETVISGQWRKLKEGIETEQWSNMDTKGAPQRYDRYAQCLVYPKADQVYTVRFWFVADLGAFTQDTDRASLDDEMILLHATANGKAHYRQPDAATYQSQVATLMASLRGQSFPADGVFRPQPQAEIERRPLVVGRDI